MAQIKHRTIMPATNPTFALAIIYGEKEEIFVTKYDIFGVKYECTFISQMKK